MPYFMLSCRCILQGLDTDTKIHFGGKNKNKKEIVTTMFGMASSFFSISFLSSKIDSPFFNGKYCILFFEEESY